MDQACDRTCLSISWRVIEAHAFGKLLQRGHLVLKPVVDAVSGLHSTREDRSLAIREETSVLEHDTRDPFAIALRAIGAGKQVRIISIATLRTADSLLAAA